MGKTTIWWRKLRAVFGIHVQGMLAYRAQAFIWIMTDIIPALIMPAVWLASFNGRPDIVGFDPKQLVMYYIVMAALTSFVISHVMWDMANEIREGQLSAKLVRPFSYYQYMFVGNLAWRIMRTLFFIPIMAVGALLYRHYLDITSLHASGLFWACLLGGHLLSFALTFTLGVLALFFQEARSIYNVYYVPMLFLSGQMVPIAMLPAWCRDISQWMPFEYTLALPTNVLLGRITDAQAVQGLGVQLAWFVLVTVLGAMLWRRGLRSYTAVGM